MKKGLAFVLAVALLCAGLGVGGRALGIFNRCRTDNVVTTQTFGNTYQIHGHWHADKTAGSGYFGDSDIRKLIITAGTPLAFEDYAGNRQESNYTYLYDGPVYVNPHIELHKCDTASELAGTRLTTYRYFKWTYEGNMPLLLYYNDSSYSGALMSIVRQEYPFHDEPGAVGVGNNIASPVYYDGPMEIKYKLDITSDGFYFDKNEGVANKNAEVVFSSAPISSSITLTLPVEKDPDEGKLKLPDMAGSYDVTWQLSDFTSSPAVYNKHLAMTSAAMSTAVYNESNVRESLRNLGFYEITQGRAGVNYAFAKKKIIVNGEIQTIVACVLRGTSDLTDWRRDFNVDPEDEFHEGFHSAFRQVAPQLDVYMNHDIEGPVKLWITGHSLGAAVGNLLAHSFTGELGQGNVYAYLFATPNVGKNITTTETNIHNIENIYDPVTKVPQSLEGHEYGKYGVRHFFALRGASDDVFREYARVGGKYSALYFSETFYALVKGASFDRVMQEHYMPGYLANVAKGSFLADYDLKDDYLDFYPDPNATDPDPGAKDPPPQSGFQRWWQTLNLFWRALLGLGTLGVLPLLSLFL
ncbi:MAG: hypothetical protein LBB75_05005 [Oscillospiraceae bacterium]|jgi:hypothetical protein|nr:hypothetical protein [Oscillospiraceae bacterium]